jgi:hypothetical protein
MGFQCHLSTSSPYWIRRMVESWGALVNTPKALQTLGILRYTVEGWSEIYPSASQLEASLIR